MNRWSNNYYTQSSNKDRRSHAKPSAPALSRSRRVSLAKTGSNGHVTLCVFRVAYLTQLTLKSHIESQGVQVLNIEQVSLRGAGYKSFAVTVKEKDAPKLLDRSFWPEKSPCHSRRVSRVGDTRPGYVEDEPRTVQAAGARPQNIIEKKAKVNNKTNPNRIKNSERQNDKELHKPLKERKQITTNDKRPKTTTHKGNKSVKLPTNTIRTKCKNSDENSLKEHVVVNKAAHRKTQTVAQRSSRTRKPYLVNSSVSKNRKAKSDTRSRKTSNKNEGKSNSKMINDARIQPEKSSVNSVPSSQVSPHHMTFTSSKKYKNVNSNTNDAHDSKYTVNKPQARQSSWTTPLRRLLSVSSEEALRRLLGPDYDRLLTQYDLTDQEIFLGVRVLAHSARADGGPKRLEQLVYKICQPQVVSLIKEFTRTVEEKYKARAERYFWDLGEFLDLYIVHNIFLQVSMPRIAKHFSMTIAVASHSIKRFRLIFTIFPSEFFSTQ
ncbi:hypothetical protein E2C01_039733 [Portunus trituberculatus]|uniref:Uncharacterized protein n=1 Tax=Portunus trituberculatus TaxID=210409 RepID=A0A5B7FKS8_PORTR|nr:hypothetical protein [Portunus trituberculatus]